MAKDLRGQRSDARHQVSINALRGHQQCILGAVLLNEDVGGVVEVEGRNSHSLPISASTREKGKPGRSEEHTSELQSHLNLVCRLLLEKKKKMITGST